MKTPEPLTLERLYELCEFAKTSPKGSLVKVNREELWALVEMAKASIEPKETERDFYEATKKLGW